MDAKSLQLLTKEAWICYYVHQNGNKNKCVQVVWFAWSAVIMLAVPNNAQEILRVISALVTAWRWLVVVMNNDYYLYAIFKYICIEFNIKTAY